MSKLLCPSKSWTSNNVSSGELNRLELLKMVVHTALGDEAILGTVERLPSPLLQAKIIRIDVRRMATLRKRNLKLKFSTIHNAVEYGYISIFFCSNNLYGGIQKNLPYRLYL